MKRRYFIQLTSANLAWLGLGAAGESVLIPIAKLRDVTVHAHVGSLFPPLELVHRILSRKNSKREFLTVTNSSWLRVSDGHDPRTIHVGFRMTELNVSPQHGNIQQSSREALMRRINALLGEEFQCRAVHITLDHGPGFWYPYVKSTAENLVFCQLIVQDASIPAVT